MAEVVPRGVKAAGDKSRELLKQAQTGGQTQTDETAAPAPVVPAAAPVTQAGSSEEVSDQVTEQGALNKPSFVDPANWEERFKRLRDQRNEKALAAEAQRDQLMQDSGSKDQRIAELEAQLNAATAQPESLVTLSDEERAQLGDAAPVFDKFASTMQERFANLGQGDEAARQAAQLEQSRASEANFYSDLESLVPNLAATDKDPGFLAWLNESDGLSGQTRMQVLQQKQAQFDAVGVANVFKAYSDSTSGQVNASHLDPGNSAGRPIVPSSEEQLAASEVWVTQSEIAQLYEDKRAARSRGHMVPGHTVFEDIKARELVIGEAMAAKRVRPG